MTVVWIALAAIGFYEVFALLTGHPTWSDLISDSLKGHPVKQVVVFTVIVLVAIHLVWGVFNRHKHQHKQPAPAYDGY